MHTLVSKLVALSVEKCYMALTEMQLKYVGFMAPLAKKVPDPCSRRYGPGDNDQRFRLQKDAAS